MRRLRAFAIAWLVAVPGGAAMLAQPPAVRPMPDMTLEAPHTRRIDKGDQSHIDEARKVLVRNDAEWTALWQQHAADRPRPAIDFSKEMVVGLFMGSRPNAGFSTAVISSTEGNGILVVRYSETFPAPGRVSAQVLTFPYDLVAIPKASVTDVKFEKVLK
jgi:protease stability complex PrcB-like protein